MLGLRGFVVLGLVFSAFGCAGSASAPVTVPTSSGAVASRGPAPAHREVMSATLPVPGPCEPAQGSEADLRCPEQILHASAMSYLDKTAAEFDGMVMRVVEHDPEDVLAEAEADPGFRRLLQEADISPADGEIDRHEAERLELAVFEVVEARWAQAGS